MTNIYDTKFNNTLQDNNVTYQESPLPYTPPEQGGGGSSKTNYFRAIFYEGGATEQTHLLSNNNTILSYTLPRQPTTKKSQRNRNIYLPTPNLSYTPPDVSGGGHYQQLETIAFNTTIPLEKSTIPTNNICPHCNNVIVSSYESDNCNWLSCL
ncbi:hypothetical protein C1645_752493 [Glomus cerebriforme]|uniref:LITAF domain-containing protein n=1 Tax=Glomus cerebriforme TaxID=658196 RepID=A0A397TLE0_9GLOM|nr:hypothetical protein C1645_752493 [Glomus cerebriforme]